MSETDTSEEYWLRGPVPGVPAVLQPVAHALLQANEEINEVLEEFDENELWVQPAGVASVGFHLQHIAGVLDRLFTYANGNSLSKQQLKYLSEEGLENEKISLSFLLDNLGAQVEKSIALLKNTDPSTLQHARGVGRKQLPSTVLGLLFHAAEHTMRHTGQLHVTARMFYE
ncbi:MAG: DinB family protein [Chitinophagaceae bacterium]|nr:DinB family protein [Chitinophagaceae bacterium]